MCKQEGQLKVNIERNKFCGMALLLGVQPTNFFFEIWVKDNLKEKIGNCNNDNNLCSFVCFYNLQQLAQGTQGTNCKDGWQRQKVPDV